MHWRQMMDRPTLGAWDFYDANGKPSKRVAKIKAVNEVMLKGIKGKIEANRKPVLTLEDSRGVEWEKKLVCGVTVCEAIAGMYGNDVRRWPGNLITLYGDQTRGQRGNTVDCVRVEPVPPKIGRGTDTSEPKRPVDEEMRKKQIDEASTPEPPKDPPREPGSDDV